MPCTCCGRLTSVKRPCTIGPWHHGSSSAPTGRRVSNELVRNAFRACLTAAGLRVVRFHDLRHTFASLLIQQGANVKYIQQQLGHGSISITLDIYSHLFHGDHRHHVHQLDDPPERTEQTGEVPPESATQPQPAQTGLRDGMLEVIERRRETADGGVTEWPNVPVLKTGVGVTPPRVQISPPPPYIKGLCVMSCGCDS